VQFPVLSDQGRETIKDYGVLAGISNIAIPSAFILDKDGVIRWKFIGDTSTRANIDTMLQQLEGLKDAVPDEVGIEIGAIAPDFTLPNADNEPVTLSADRGWENVVVIFYRGDF
jgi:peroxiredoxin